MADVLSVLSSAGNADATLAGLRSVLRSSYATGRSSRAVLRAVLQLCGNSDHPPPLRLLAYEVCWTIVAATDGSAYRALLACARNDMLVADHPDLSLAALHTVAGMPACYAPDLMAADDVERTMTDAMTGDAPPAVRCASVAVFAQVCVRCVCLCCVCGYVRREGGPKLWRQRPCATIDKQTGTGGWLRCGATSCDTRRYHRGRSPDRGQSLCPLGVHCRSATLSHLRGMMPACACVRMCVRVCE